MSDEAKPPCGVLAIITSPDGYVIATATDFERSTPGGCHLYEGQKYRAKRQVIFAVIAAYCSSAMSSVIDDYVAERIWDALRNKGKHRLTYRSVGYSGDVKAEIES